MSETSSSEQNKLQKLMSSSIARPLALMLIIALALAGNVAYSHFGPDKYRDARQTANTFLTAYTSCDLQTARKYYLAFQSNTAAVANYQRQCRKGDISFSYDSPGQYSEKTTKGVRSINLSLYYKASQNGGTSAKFIVYMLWNSTLKQWTVTSIAPATQTSK